MLAMNGVAGSSPSSSEVKYPPNVANQRGLSQTDLEVDKLYEPKQNKKIVRIFTVILYMFSVSLGAILLSLYYVFLWKNPHTQHLRDSNQQGEENTSTASTLLETTLSPDFMDLEPRAESQMEEIKFLQSGVTAFPKRTRGVPPVASRHDSRLQVDLPAAFSDVEDVEYRNDRAFKRRRETLSHQNEWH